MDWSTMIERTLEHQKAVLHAGYNTMVFFQGQTEKLVTRMLEKSSVPKEALKVVENTFCECKKKGMK